MLNALQDKLETLDLVISPPNELGNTRPEQNSGYEASYSDHSFDIYVISLKTALLHSNLVLNSVVD